MASKGITNFKSLEKSILLSYLKAYRAYLIVMKENKTINEEYYNTQLNDTLHAIEVIEENRILL